MTDLAYLDGLPELPDTTGPALTFDPKEYDPGYIVLACTPLLVAETSTGGLKFWQGFAVQDAADPFTCYTRAVSYSRTGKPGAYGFSKLSAPKPKRIKGKNVGRSNETTPATQAVLELTSKEADQRKKNYWTCGEPMPEFDPKPMLAHAFKKRGKDIVFPAAAQPKYDGHRMLYREVGATREALPVIPEVIAHHADTIGAVARARGIHVDGENLLPALPGETRVERFQRTSRAIKKYRADWDKVVFHVYDCYDPSQPDLTFRERHELLTEIVEEARALAGDGPFHVELVGYQVVNDEAELEAYFDDLVVQGWEGAMVRNLDLGAYDVGGNRSVHLQKLKPKDSAEFEIVGQVEAEGSDEGTGVFLLRAPDHAGAALPLPWALTAVEIMGDAERKRLGIFKARPMGTLETRAEWYRNRYDLVGAPCTVEFDGYTEDGVPRIPRAVGPRLELA